MDPAEFEATTIAAIDEAAHRWKMIPLLVSLGLLIVLGLLGTAASVYTAQTTSTSSKADVERSRQLIEQVKLLQAENADKSDAKYVALCEQLNAVALQLNVPLDDWLT